MTIKIAAAIFSCVWTACLLSDTAGRDKNKTGNESEQTTS